MIDRSRRKGLWVAAGVVVTWLVPLMLFWYFIGRAPTVDPDRARELLSRPDSEYMLVDTRLREDYAAGHIEGSVNWPFEHIMSTAGKASLPETVKNKKMILICYSGISSAVAASHLLALGHGSILSVAGGMETWMAKSGKPCLLSLCRLKTGSGETRSFPWRKSTLLEQWSACIAAFGIKPLYMLLSFILILWIRKLSSPDVAALRWALIGFLTGEAFCAVNYLFFGEDSYFVEYMHSFGMALAFGFSAYALFLALDHRVVHYGEAKRKCALLEQCGVCIKQADVSCAVRRLYLLATVVFALLSLMPLAADYHGITYNTEILGADYSYTHPAIYQIFEVRYCPVIALIFFAAGLATFYLRKADPLPFAKTLLASGLGFLGFSMFRLVLFQVYQDNLTWFVFWEEVTELIYVTGVGVTLWIFRGKLFREEATEKKPSVPVARHAEDGHSD
jgi:rhodanese-related sulfurtransferase